MNNELAQLRREMEEALADLERLGRLLCQAPARALEETLEALVRV